MNSRSINPTANIDWVSILLYLLLVWSVNICRDEISILDIKVRETWFDHGFRACFLVLLTDSKFFTTFSMVITASWYFCWLPSCFCTKPCARGLFNRRVCQFATNLAIAYIMSCILKVRAFPAFLTIGLILVFHGLIILQNDTGSALVL